MLNIGVKLSLDVSQKQYPIYFERHNICVHCGAEGSLIFVDKFGRETKKEIHPFDHIKCTKCGRKYSILWKKDENVENKMFPVAVDPGFKQELVNLLLNKKIKNSGEKVL